MVLVALFFGCVRLGRLRFWKTMLGVDGGEVRDAGEVLPFVCHTIIEYE